MILRCLFQAAKRVEDKEFTFDRVYAGPVTTRDIFNDIVVDIAPRVVQGEHATVFAYGATGSGWF